MKYLLSSLVATSWLLFSCTGDKVPEDVTDQSQLKQDSFIVSFSKVDRGWHNTYANRREFQTRDSILQPDWERRGLQKCNLMDITKVELVQLNDTVFAEYNYRPYKIHTLKEGKVVTKELPQLYTVNGKDYVPQVRGHNSYVLKPNGNVLIYLLYWSRKYDDHVDTLMRYHNLNRLGEFSICGDSLCLESLIDINPRKHFFKNDTRCLSVRSILIGTGHNGFYSTYNFIDTLFHFDFDGNLIKAVGLPSDLHFQYFERDKSIKRQTPEQLDQSGFMGHKIQFMHYEPTGGRLGLIVSEHISGDDENFTPSYDELPWKMLLYDTELNTWTHTVQFSGQHNKRYVSLSPGNFYVSQLPDYPLTYDVYHY